MSETQTLNMRSMADLLGLCGASICTIHCLVAPLLLVAGTALPASILGDESFHRVMLWIVLPSGVLAFGMGCWRHKDRRVLLLGVLGITGLGLSTTWFHDVLGDSGERVVTVVSAAALVTAHVRNWRLCRASDCAHDCDSVEQQHAADGAARCR